MSLRNVSSHTEYTALGPRRWHVLNYRWENLNSYKLLERLKQSPHVDGNDYQLFIARFSVKREQLVSRGTGPQ
jgi:hypothetical protein